MKLGVMAVLFRDLTLEESAKLLSSMGVQALEIGCGGYPGDAYCKPAELLADQAAQQAFLDVFKRHNLELCALSTHNNPVSPDKAFAQKSQEEIKNAILLAEKIGLDHIITFSGCPGDAPGATYPNWVTCSWPPEYGKILEYQWNEVLIPYWVQTAKFAREHGVKVALEMHPGFCVYNPESMLKLRAAAGPEIGANFDPSHLFWQGIDPVSAIRSLGDAIFHVHAKDTKIDPMNTATNGVLETKGYGQEINRSWLFRTVGYGHDTQVWNDIVSTLRLVNYDGVLSIEHEDSLMTSMEGLSKAVEFLKKVLMFEDKGPMYWA